ncbi:hypothetical protein MNBD_GAMMA12-1535, partial [hydrothermal vent metagenome]
MGRHRIIAVNAAVTKRRGDSLEERILSFRKVEDGNSRLYFQVKGANQSTLYAKLIKDVGNEKTKNKSKKTIKKALEDNKYPLNLDANDYWIPIAIGQSKKENPNKIDDSAIKLSPIFPLTFSEPDIN